MLGYFVGIALGLWGLSNGGMPTPRLSGETLQRVCDATGWILAGTQGVGTGWLIDAQQRWMITNAHVVGNAPRVEVFFPVYQDGQRIAPRDYYLSHRELLRQKGRLVSARVHARQPQFDVAILQLDSLPEAVMPLELATEWPAIGEPLFAVGQRQDLDLLWILSQGFLRQVAPLPQGYFVAGQSYLQDQSVLLVQLPISEGDSGSALVNTRGQVVGIVSAVRKTAPAVSFAVPIWGWFPWFRQVAPTVVKQAAVPPPSRNLLKANALAKRLAEATVRVRPGSSDHRGAGFVLDVPRRLILTTATAVGSSDQLAVMFPQWDQQQLVGDDRRYLDRYALRQNGHEVAAVVLARDTLRDLALLECDRMPPRVQSLPWSDRVEVGNAVATMNHPVGVEVQWLFAQGIVRQCGSMVLASRGASEGQPVRVLLTQLPAQGSASGSAVVDEQGKVVGLLAAREAPQQQVGFVVAAEELRMFLNASQPLWNPQTADQWAQRAARLRQLHRDAEALAALSQAIRQRPNDPRLHRLRGELAWWLGDRKMAQTDCEIAESAPVLDAETYLLRARLTNDPPEKALRFADTWVRQFPQHPHVYVWRAELRRHLGRIEAALSDCEEALWQMPNCAAAFRLRASILWQREQHDEAIRDLERAVEADPLHQDSIHLLAQWCQQRREFKKAASVYRQLLDFAPDHALARLGLGQALLDIGEDAKAVPELVLAVRSDAKQLAPMAQMVLRHADRIRDRSANDRRGEVDWLRSVLSALRSLPEKPSWQAEGERCWQQLEHAATAADAAEVLRRQFRAWMEHPEPKSSPSPKK